MYFIAYYVPATVLCDANKAMDKGEKMQPYNLKLISNAFGIL